MAYMQLLTNEINIFSEASKLKHAWCFRTYIPRENLIMSLVCFERLLDLLK